MTVGVVLVKLKSGSHSGLDASGRGHGRGCRIGSGGDSGNMNRDSGSVVIVPMVTVVVGVGAGWGSGTNGGGSRVVRVFLPRTPLPKESAQQHACCKAFREVKYLLTESMARTLLTRVDKERSVARICGY